MNIRAIKNKKLLQLKTIIDDYDDFTRIWNFMSLAKMDLAEQV